MNIKREQFQLPGCARGEEHAIHDVQFGFPVAREGVEEFLSVGIPYPFVLQQAPQLLGRLGAGNLVEFRQHMNAFHQDALQQQGLARAFPNRLEKLVGDSIMRLVVSEKVA